MNILLLKKLLLFQTEPIKFFLSIFLSFCLSFLSFPPQQAVLHRIAVGHNITADYCVHSTQF